MRNVEVVYDIMGPGHHVFVVRAKVKLLSVEEGGYPHPKGRGYRPNHNFGDPQNCSFYIGQINFLDREIAQPGDEFEASVRFLDGRGLREMLLPGRTWRIQEGTSLVGFGEILSVEVLEVARPISR